MQQAPLLHLAEAQFSGRKRQRSSWALAQSQPLLAPRRWAAEQAMPMPTAPQPSPAPSLQSRILDDFSCAPQVTSTAAVATRPSAVFTRSSA